MNFDFFLLISQLQEKARRKLEGEVRIAHENMDELGKQRADAESSLKRKEADLFALSVRFEESQAQGAKLQRQAQASFRTF